SGDHLGLNYITTVQELAVLKRVIVQNVAPGGVAVLNAADPHVHAMAGQCKGSVTFFARDRHHPVMATHRAQGHAVVYVENGWLVAEKSTFKHAIALRQVPFTLGGAIAFQVENALAAVAAAWALGLDWERMERGLLSFSNAQDNAAGRFHLFQYRGATVIADYGHNPDAMAALVQAVQAIPATRRSVVISGAGDRRDQDIRQQTRILGCAFDEVVLFEDQCQRGRQDGEVIALLRDGLQGATRTTQTHEIKGEFRAIDLAMDRLQAGELCLILVDQVEAAMAHIQGRVRSEE
ncbi:MAG: Mur ligase family protein, partial [Rhodoferax sp.]|nr:Mur ligase family protein [Rhodoferax sp.]